MTTVQNEITCGEAQTAETAFTQTAEGMKGADNAASEASFAVSAEEGGTGEASVGESAALSDATDGSEEECADGSEASDASESAGVQRYMFEQLRQINERFPDIKSLDDIVRLEKYKQIKEKVTLGYTLSDAVRLVYEDEYISARLSKAQAQARREMVSSSHLSATRASGGGISDVSERDIRSYMEAIPGASREDAIRAYKKYKIKK